MDFHSEYGLQFFLIVKHKPKVVLHVVLQQCGGSESSVRSILPGSRMVFSGIFPENQVSGRSGKDGHGASGKEADVARWW